MKDKEKQRDLIIEIMKADEESGLYDKLSRRQAAVKEAIKDLKLEEVLGSSGCHHTVVENKLAQLYRNQEKILTAIKLLSNEK